MKISSKQNGVDGILRKALSTDGDNVSTHVGFAKHTVTKVQKSLFKPEKKQVSLFKCLQQRAIVGCGSSKVVDCLHFLANLARRQLLLPSELRVLGQALAQGDCIIEPELCRSYMGIVRLRVLSVFLMELHKSPQIREALEYLIDNESVKDGSKYFISKYIQRGMRDKCAQYSVANIKHLHGELVSVLQNYNAILPDHCDEKKSQYLKELLKPLINDLAFFGSARQLITHLNDSDDHRLLHSDLMNLIDNLGCAIRSIDNFDDRIDRMVVTKVVVFHKSFSNLMNRYAYERRLKIGIPTLNTEETRYLLECKYVLGGNYADMMQCRSIIEKSIDSSDSLSSSPMENITDYLWLYYRGIHIEFDINYRYRQLSPSIKQQYFHEDDDLHLPLLRYPQFRGWLQYVSYNWLVGLYLELHKWLNESRPVADKTDVFAFVDNIWGCEYSTLDDFQWLISVIARSGLAPYGEKDCSESISMLCPYCKFDGQVWRRDLIKDAAPYVHQLHSQFLALLRNHKQIRECNIAQSVEPERLCDERHQFT